MQTDASRITFLDGGFGTCVQELGLPPGKDPADWNIENPSAVRSVHTAYVKAGAQIVVTNTFGANALKYHGAHDLEDVVKRAVELARQSGAQRVALDVGPCGRLLKPIGDLSVAVAHEAFATLVEQGARAGSDLVLIETMSDVHELRTAVLAAKEVCSLPIYATVALSEGGHLLTGADVETVAALLESLGVAAYGFNCGLGPDQLLPYVQRLAVLSTKPIIVKPNAGMPRTEGGKTIFDIGPEAFARSVQALVDAGASIVGGCCGTTPDHIAALANIRPGACRAVSEPATIITSATRTLSFAPHQGVLIGERINPTGKKRLKEAYRTGDVAFVMREAVAQVEAGAVALDINCGVPGIDEPATLERTIEAVESVVSVPIQIDTSDPVALERALRVVSGKALINSVNASAASLNAVLPRVRQYGGTMVALCLDEHGIPPTVEGRLALAHRILDEGAKYGFTRKDFIFDALTLSVSTDPQAAVITLETVRRLTEELRVNTILGVSNVSFGLPNRAGLNNVMYALAKRAGLSAAIANPAVLRDEITPLAEDVLLGRDPQCARWIAAANEHADSVESVPPPPDDVLGLLREDIRRGLMMDAGEHAAQALAGEMPPMVIIEQGIVPALENVGRGFEAGRVYLPQLLRAADAAGSAFEAVRKALGESAAPERGPIVLATVKGDVHDIGKNICRALLENYGFRVIDLGRDVPAEKVVESVQRAKPRLVGLSALMTTTVGAMAETIAAVHAHCPGVPVTVGGAVLTPEFAREIHADHYTKDAMQLVRLAGELC